MRLLDLFCGAGGAAKGYADAGFDVVGVDIKPQPHYPYEFHQADVIEFLIEVHRFDAIHASPPCQWGTAYKRRPGHVKESPNLVADTRTLLYATGLPYVIEQPWGNAHALHGPLKLCGSMFGLEVQRHRAFETNWLTEEPPPCDHSVWTAQYPPATNRTNLRKTVEVGVWRIPLSVQQKAMGGCEWMTLSELSQAIPPAYTHWLGRQLHD